MKPDVKLDNSLDGRVRVSSLWMQGATVTNHGGAFAELETIANDMREAYPDHSLGQVPGVGDARRLYRDFGIDPTRTRPSSEALLRRALKELALYNVNDVVDWGNAVSLRHLLPLGLYDAGQIDGDEVRVRVGHTDEEYAGIRKGPVHVAQRLCVADDQGAFGSPTSDSLRTSIRDQTNRLLIVVFAPPQCPVDRLEAATEMLSTGFQRHAGATEVRRLRLDP